VVEKSGSWFSYDSQRVGQGRENGKIFLRDNPAIADQIEIAIRTEAGLTGGGPGIDLLDEEPEAAEAG
jgi:recombination protein RecA